MGICAKCVHNLLFFQYTFGNISSMAFLLLSKLNSNTLGYLTAFHPDICSVSTCVWIQTHPNICEFKKSTLNRSKFTGLIMLSWYVRELGLYVLQILKAVVLIFPWYISYSVFFFSKQEGQVWTVRGLETSWGKYSECSTSEDRFLLMEKNSTSKFAVCGSAQRGQDLCRGEQQTVGAKWRKEWAKWTFKST